MSHWFWTAFGMVEVCYVAVMAVWIVLQKRSPSATVAWLLGTALLPIGGFFVYLLFGPRRVEKSRLRRMRAKQAIHTSGLSDYEGRFAEQVARAMARQIARIGEAANQSSISAATRCVLHTDGDETFDRIVATIDASTHHVHVLYYIFEPDTTGTRVLEALTRAARRGVEVRLLVDGVGSANLSQKTLKALREAGGHAAFFNRVSLFRRLRRINFRNHRKVVVVDGRIGFVGGMNVHDDESARSGRAAWRDTHLELEGPCVSWLQLVFLEDWHYTRGFAPKGDAYFPPLEAGSASEPVQILDSGPDSMSEPIKLALFSAIGAAKTRVWITTAYFVPDEAMLTALKAAALRGVDVRLLLSSVTDSRLVQAASRSFYDELLACRIRIYEYRGRMLHAKTMLVDDWFSCVGTANMDNRSFRLNFEVVALVYGASMAARLASVFSADLSQSRPVIRTGGRAPLGKRLAEGGARLLAPLL